MTPTASPTAIEIWNSVVLTVTAVGGVALAILAIWGESIKMRLVGPSLRPELHSHGDTLIRANVDNKVMAKCLAYHIAVHNSRPHSPARNCQVSLHGIHREVNGKHESQRLAVPLPFAWAPYGAFPIERTIAHEAVLDFGLITELDHGKGLTLQLAHMTTEFDGRIIANTPTTLDVQITADNIREPVWFNVKVEWDGEWVSSAEGMKKHLKVEVGRFLP